MVKYAQGTGGGPPAEDNYEKHDLKIIEKESDVCLTGHTTSSEPAVEFVS